MKLFVAEKPSVAKNIAEALAVSTKKDGYYEGNGYLVTWAFGHLLELYDAKDYDQKMARWKLENFPFIPTAFQYKVKANPRNRKQRDGGAVKQLKTIHTLIRRQDVKEIISACDYDREGQLIGDSIIYKSKTNKPVLRLLLNEWTPAEIKRGLVELKPNQELRPLLNAGLSRQWTDWLIGINLTSVATLKYQTGKGKVLNIGRVLLPTLKIIYDRDREIKTFQPEPYYKLAATFQPEDKQSYQGIYTEEKDKFTDQATLQAIESQLKDQQAVVSEKQVKRKKEYPPSLFNLSQLQGYITSRFQGWTADKVLKVAQSLYEKKYITYPRTSSTALDESLVKKAAQVLEVHSKALPYRDEINFFKNKRVFNNAKVDSHSAIIPTYLLPKRLSQDEQRVYEAIRNRFIMQFMPIAEYDETIIRTEIPSLALKGIFVTKGRIQQVAGWKQVEHIEVKDVLLPDLYQGEAAVVTQSELSTHMTKPPKKHTERTLLSVMETCGKASKQEEEGLVEVLKGYSIGTPATRAETIKKLIDIKYIKRVNKQLECTALGQQLVQTFPIKQLFDLNFTGQLEKSLYDVERNQLSKQAFLTQIYQFTKESVAIVKEDQAKPIRVLSRPSKQEPSKNEQVGTCPLCDHPIIEGKKGFGCSNWQAGCQFVIWKRDKFLASFKKQVTKTMAKQLLAKGKVFVKGLKSKNGKVFSAYLSYQQKADSDVFSWDLQFEDGKQGKRP
ncbi:DNA topoisomerase-3 [Amphibacillus marinus]|uniref:DNA topoisomerase n=1 Tax=Amphibacillus marinus TaxID=872970 RepID=A0A1H8STS4_9BACI|nr:type IA DNA topoisomerase [Amphibacillus marinus]SEO81734.1 DNA topoisomerase-3 [Amphibacillus marinus]